MTANQKCGFLPCRGGPYDGKDLMAGDDVPEGWRITISVPTGQTIGGQPGGLPLVRSGVYVRKDDVLVWEAMK